jgi:hydrogenase nickel incorporation protein HypA/HybF
MLGGRGVHELSLMEDLVQEVVRAAEGVRVHRIRLEIGELAAVAPEALRFCFEICARDTSAEGATLELVRTTGKAMNLTELEVG